MCITEGEATSELYRGGVHLKVDDDIALLTAKVQKELDSALDDDIPFEKNKAVMKDPGPQVVTNVAMVLQKYPFVDVLVDGHAAGKKNTPYLQKLSTSRAEAVRDKLVTDGVEEKRLRFQGSGAAGRGMHVFIVVTNVDKDMLKRTSRHKAGL